MIFDTLKNCALYYSTNDKFEKAFDFIKKAVKDNLEVGKYEIDGKNLYAFIQEYNSKIEPDGKYEGHQNYIDIQYIISGIERIEVIDIEKAQPKTDYDPVKDVQFYFDPENKINAVLESEDYGIFFPNDIHKPGMSLNGVSSPVKKVVVKIKID